MSKSEARQLLEELHRLYSLVSVLSWIAKRFDKAVDVIEKQHAIDDVLREFGEYLADSIDRIDRIMLLILERLPADNISPRAKQETSELLQETIESRKRSLKRQLLDHQGSLNALEEKSAKYGINVPLEVTNGIIFEKEKIKRLKDEFALLREG